MRKPIMAGNWKMNGTKAGVQELLQSIRKGATNINNVEWIVLPPFPFLEQTEKLLSGTNIAWGAQNLSDKLSGAYTGEVSATMLKDFGCSYVLVGHSERRNIFGEGSELVANKFVTACDVGLIPIFCVGETLEERKIGRTQEIVCAQVNAVLELNDGIQRLCNAIIAYEPVWAIGTGDVATPGQAQEVHQYIRELIAKVDGNVARQIRILYGGSVKPDNAKALFSMPDIDGGLIGGASLKADNFLEIGRLCNK
ncbi:MAG: triosephosphate isomerase [Coxiella sp. DG_40]|nr:MAG: triosephosphate isomerase [Coxiella sp. DG_40]